MPSLVVSLLGKPLASHAIDRPCTRIGRAPGNDVVLDSPTVSSAHAVLLVAGDRLAIEDLGSSNGTFLGRTRVARADLEDGSVVAIGDYRLRLVADRKAMAYEPTMLVRAGTAARKAYLQRLDGARPGELIELTKVVSTIGKPGEGLVTVIRRGDDFAVRFADGHRRVLNGTEQADAPVRLNAGDVLDTDMGRLQFLLQDSGLPSPGPVDRGAAGAVAGPLSWLRRAMGRVPSLSRNAGSQDQAARSC